MQSVEVWILPLSIVDTKKKKSTTTTVTAGSSMNAKKVQLFELCSIGPVALKTP